jgi:rubrerythrin
MNDDANNKNANRQDGSSPKTLAGFLTSAIDMEEQVSDSVYRDYLDRANWPIDLKPDVFQTIRKHLTVLIEDSKKHSKILRTLTERYGNDTGSRQKENNQRA